MIGLGILDGEAKDHPAVDKRDAGGGSGGVLQNNNRALDFSLSQRLYCFGDASKPCLGCFGSLD